MKSYISIDIETTGLDRDNHMVLEIGAVIDDWMSSIDSLPKFRCYVDNGPLIQGSPYALSMHPKILRYIATNGREREPDQEGIVIVEQEHVAEYFLKWLQKWGIMPVKRHITAAGKNFASFDRQFLKQLPDWEDFVKTQHRCIDPGNLYWDPTIDGQGLPSMKTCKERAGIPGEVAHTAVKDALDVVRLVRAWFDCRWSK